MNNRYFRLILAMGLGFTSSCFSREGLAAVVTLKYIEAAQDLSSNPAWVYRFVTAEGVAVSVSVSSSSERGYGWSIEGVAGTGLVGDPTARRLCVLMSTALRSKDMGEADIRRIVSLISYLTGEGGRFKFAENYVADCMQTLRSKPIAHIIFSGTDGGPPVLSEGRLWLLFFDNAPTITLSESLSGFRIAGWKYRDGERPDVPDFIHLIERGGPWSLLLAEAIRVHLAKANTLDGWREICEVYKKNWNQQEIQYSQGFYTDALRRGMLLLIIEKKGADQLRSKDVPGK